MDQHVVPNLDIAARLKEAFGARYAVVWHHPINGTFFVAVQDAMPTDQGTAESIVEAGAAIQVVPSEYSAMEFEDFQRRLSPLIEELASSSAIEPRIYSTGIGVRDNDFSATGHPVLRINATECDEAFQARVTALVPIDAVEFRRITAPRPY